MAFANMLRRSAASVVPMAIRVVGSQRYLISAGCRHRQLSRSSFPSVLHFSSTSKRPTFDESPLKSSRGRSNTPKSLTIMVRLKMFQTTSTSRPCAPVTPLRRASTPLLRDTEVAASHRLRSPLL
ncbi:hypothetical protein U1Q18_034268, partial [Sarracenia purpurea var. burkii]